MSFEHLINSVLAVSNSIENPETRVKIQNALSSLKKTDSYHTNE